MAQKKTPADRVWLLDELRGFALVMMVLYHGLFDLILAFGWEIPLFFSPAMELLRDLFAGLFIFLAGVTCRYSRSNLRRGLLYLGAGMVLTLVTAAVTPSQRIAFGILHFMGAAVLLFWLLRPLLDRLSPGAGLFLCGVLYGFTRGVQDGYLGFSSWGLRLPALLFEQKWLFPLGICAPGFFSGDYYPLFPWVFVLLAGSFAGTWFRKKQAPAWVYPPHCKALAWVGRHSLEVYLLHQPVLFLLGLLLQFL